PAIPLYLWGLQGASRLRLRGAIPLAVVLGCILGALSMFAASMFLFPLFLAWTLLVAPENRKQFLLLLVFFGAGWLFMEAPTLVPAIIHGKSSHRAGWVVSALLPGQRSASTVLTLFVLENALPLVVALFALATQPSSTKSKLRYLLALLAIACLLYAG